MEKLKIYIDEAGRGPLFGPVYTGLVLPLDKFDTSSFDDSKKLSHKQREKLLNQINTLAQNDKILKTSTSSSAKDIDRFGITQAINISISQGVFNLLQSYFYKILQPKLIQSENGYDLILNSKLDSYFKKSKLTHQQLSKLISIFENKLKIQIIIDGITDYNLYKYINQKVITIKKGDSKVPYISMASIIAKVNRDHEIVKTSSKFDKDYYLANNKGYGTSQHRKAIQKLGVTPQHRKSYLKKFQNFKSIKKYHKNKLRYGYKNAYGKKLIKNNSISQKEKPSLLLHICCGPDLCHPLKILKKHFDLYLYWHNPNITNQAEHAQRYKQYEKVLEVQNGNWIKLQDEYSPDKFQNFLWDNKQKTPFKNTKDQSTFQEQIGQLPEQSIRCSLCYEMRLKHSGQLADQKNIDFFTSTLTISPHKDLNKLKSIGKTISKSLQNTQYLHFDFRKNNGFQKTTKLSKKYNLYRQNYCGCTWSKKD